jgi:alkanesulfonate monooxygenase SsuD/methylene tetrahydromethanopterin reductase-like flavin-dependent oxidoreductase (luciferase family)
LRRAGRLCDGWISANSSTNELGHMIGRIQHHREESGRANLPFENQVMCAEAYYPDGIHRLEDMGVTEVLVGFRDAYAGGEDTRTLDQMLGEINSYADSVIHKA